MGQIMGISILKMSAIGPEVGNFLGQWGTFMGRSVPKMGLKCVNAMDNGPKNELCHVPETERTMRFKLG